MVSRHSFRPIIPNFDEWTPSLTFDPLSLLYSCCSCDAGVTDIEIHFLQIKYNAIGIYMEKEIIQHLADWKGKKGSELAEDDVFFDAVVSGDNYIWPLGQSKIWLPQSGLCWRFAVPCMLAADYLSWWLYVVMCSSSRKILQNRGD